MAPAGDIEHDVPLKDTLDEHEPQLIETLDKSFSRKHTPVNPAKIIIAPAKYANGLKNSNPTITIIPITILVRFRDFIFALVSVNTHLFQSSGCMLLSSGTSGIYVLCHATKPHFQ